MIKKTLISLFVLATFIIYSVNQRGDSSSITPTVNTIKPTIQTTSAPPPTATGQYKDGTYTGNTADAFYGYIQVQATISGGKLSDVEFLQYPNDQRNSVAVNDYAMPQLKQQAVQAQTAHVDGVSGATDTSQAFVQSLGSALQQAKA